MTLKVSISSVEWCFFLHNLWEKLTFLRTLAQFFEVLFLIIGIVLWFLTMPTIAYDHRKSFTLCMFLYHITNISKFDSWFNFSNGFLQALPSIFNEFFGMFFWSSNKKCFVQVSMVASKKIVVYLFLYALNIIKWSF